MHNQILLYLFALLFSAIASSAYADECDDPKLSEQIAQCLGKDLRDSDAKINSSYKELMGKLNESDKTNLRQAQRNWIKDRDSACQLDSKESDRERWYQALLKDYAKTVCVTRYTRQRTIALNSMLDKLSTPKNTPSSPLSPPAPVAPNSSSKPGLAYDSKPVTSHSSGKWYFELAVNYKEAVMIEPCVLTVGVSSQQVTSGILDNIRPIHANKEVMRYGFAVDLDNGKVYVSKNGVWQNGEPGSNIGHDLKLGRDYYVGFSLSADNPAPYLERKAIVPNFGDSAMTYALPAGYTPWRNKTLN